MLVGQTSVSAALAPFRNRSYKTHVVIGEAFRAKFCQASLFWTADFWYPNQIKGK